MQTKHFLCFVNKSPQLTLRCISWRETKQKKDIAVVLLRYGTDDQCQGRQGAVLGKQQVKKKKQLLNQYHGRGLVKTWKIVLSFYPALTITFQEQRWQARKGILMVLESIYFFLDKHVPNMTNEHCPSLSESLYLFVNNHRPAEADAQTESSAHRHRIKI